ncbi:MAG: hypothetical protein EB075_12880, partial [Bacteroidetes bacterium]|nr:hypothetical protein [Bacteroidota bacterium]
MELDAKSLLTSKRTMADGRLSPENLEQNMHSLVAYVLRYVVSLPPGRVDYTLKRGVRLFCDKTYLDRTTGLESLYPVLSTLFLGLLEACVSAPWRFSENMRFSGRPSLMLEEVVSYISEKGVVGIPIPEWLKPANADVSADSPIQPTHPNLDKKLLLDEVLIRLGLNFLQKAAQDVKRILSSPDFAKS